MRVKEETVEEIIGFLRSAKTLMTPFPTLNVNNLVDIALPYDGKAKGLQTGVIACLVLSAAGIPIILHGADDIPAKCGVTPLNLLRELGYPVDISLSQIAQNIENHYFGVLNIGEVFPQWTALTPIRHHFGLRTLMNSVEKLFNPANAPIHISGFYHSSYLKRMSQALPGTSRNWIMQGEEGSVDVRPGKKTRVYHADGDDMIETLIDAEALGYPNYDPLETPNDVKAHAKILRRVIDGERCPAFDQVVLTAGTLLWMVGGANDVQAGIEHAKSLILDGRVKQILDHRSQKINTL